MSSRILTAATVQTVRSISPTVKHLKIHVENKEVTFKPGQWVDFFIPGVSTTGGFSMCSSPTMLEREQTLDLAVKYSTHPPAHWVHHNCVDGTPVSLQVGGNFSYEMNAQNLGDNILLIAAGVGINPILSIMKHIHEVHRANQQHTSSFGNTLLFYTATSSDELIFKDDISAMVAEDSSFKTHLFATRQSNPTSVTSSNIEQRRMKREDFESNLSLLGISPKEVISYMCAPEPMMKEMDAMLTNIGLIKQNIRYESWW